MASQEGTITLHAVEDDTRPNGYEGSPRAHADPILMPPDPDFALRSSVSGSNNNRYPGWVCHAFVARGRVFGAGTGCKAHSVHFYQHISFLCLFSCHVRRFIWVGSPFPAPLPPLVHQPGCA